MRLIDNFDGNSVRAFFQDASSSILYIAAPFFTDASLFAGNAVPDTKVIVRLSEATSPDALKTLLTEKIPVKFFVGNFFHPKIYITSNSCLVGSANMTQAGMEANYEACIQVGRAEQQNLYDEVKDLFFKYWNDRCATELTQKNLCIFKRVKKLHPHPKSDFNDNLKKKLLENDEWVDLNDFMPAAFAKVDWNRSVYYLRLIMEKHLKKLGVKKRINSKNRNEYPKALFLEASGHPVEDLKLVKPAKGRSKGGPGLWDTMNMTDEEAAGYNGNAK